MKVIKKYQVITIFILLTFLTVLGSLYDFKIANKLYLGQKTTDNLFGIIFSFIGIIPTFVGWSFLGASIYYLSRKNINDIKKRRWSIALAIFLFVLSFFFFCNTLLMVNSNAFKVHWLIAYPVGILIIIGAGYLGYKLAKQSDNPELLKTILFLSFVSLLVMIIVMTTKEIMDRPRFRLVHKLSDSDYYINWWESGAKLKESLNLNEISDEFSSFPSGHSAYAMFGVFIFPALCSYIPKTSRYKSLFVIFGFVFWALTALSRMTVGAHYLTDVAVGGLITLISYVIIEVIWWFVLKKKKL